jgi:nucleotide-binding universal stress UspA family protein
MAYRDLQVHVDNSASCAKRLHVAAEIAAKFDSHLTGIFIRPPFHLPSYALPVNIESEWIDTIAQDYETGLDTKEHAAKRLFDEITTQYQATTLWQPVKGDVYTVLGEEAAYADLLILGQPDPDDSTNNYTDLPDRTLLTSGRPCLVVPYIGARENMGKHPLVAWNGTRESNRALHDAMPVLEQAETVTIMISQASGSPAKDELPNTKIAQHLARHNVKVMTKTLTEEKNQTSNAFLSYIADNDHDLLVMGAYGHSRIREIVLGGMTREIMQSMTVPVLMSH